MLKRLLVIAAVVAVLGAALATAVGSSPVVVRTIGGPAIAETTPGGLDVDPAGNVYVANTGNDTVAKYTAGLNVREWVTGTRGGPLAAGSFEDPRDVAYLNGEVFVADTAHQWVQVLAASDGHYLRKISFAFRNPIGISTGVDGAGDPIVLVSEGGTGAVDTFTPAGAHLRTIAPHNGSTSGTRDAATNSAGEIYAADYRHARIEKYAADGTWISEFGVGAGGTPTCAQIPGPYGVDVDASGRVYVAVSNTNRIRVFDANGACLSTIGTPGTGELQLSQLRRVAVGDGADPLVYAADLWGIKVLVYHADGTLATPSRLGDWPLPGPGGMNEVPGVAVTSDRVWVADLNNHRVQSFALDGTSPVAWGKKGKATNAAQFNWPHGIAVNPVSGEVWVADTHNNRVMEFTQAGTWIRTLGPAGNTAGKFNWPIALAFDTAGNLYVADMNNRRVQSFTAAGVWRWSSPTLTSTSGVAYDPVGDRVLAVESSIPRFRTLDPATGAITGALTFTKGTTPGKLLTPRGVAVDPADGTMWIVDTGNSRISKFTATGVYAGVTFGAWGAGGDAALNNPRSVSFGADGKLYVADSWNSRVQVIQP